MDLFESRKEQVLRNSAPLADRMRPRTLEEYIGQDHIIGEGRLLRRAIQIDQLSSVIFYGPPGTGKTTLARIIANTTKAQFISINAVLAGVKEIRESIETAQKTLSLYGRRTILFVDEVHRFNKSQQDALLPHVENGLLILIGATTENPYFEVNKALVSRSRIFQLKQLTEVDLKAVAHQALRDSERGFGKKDVIIDEDALDHLAQVANGDARGVLNALELAVETTTIDTNGRIHITRDIAEESIQQRAVLYDKDGDAHYDTISAFIKSVRGSDPDAALYWMAKMVYAGEHPRFIFRRMLILACEDIGMADPNALTIVMNAAQAFEYVGLPEGRFHLGQACLYLATAPKSNSTMAFFDALNQVTHETNDEVPNHLKDASRDNQGFGHGDGYLYPHAYRDHWVAQQYLPESLQGKLFYQPSDQGYEHKIKERVAQNREAQLEAMVDEEATTPLEDILTKEEKDGAFKGWVKRTHGGRGQFLGAIRERVLSLCPFQRDSLFLDLNARTGLLTMEATRRIPEGGVWSLTYDSKASSTLNGLIKGFDPLTRPQVVQTTIESFDIDIREAAGKSVRFDIVAGRNVLTKCVDKIGVVTKIGKLLRDGGVLALAEVVPSEGQRLSETIDLTRLGTKISDEFRKCEDALFSDTVDPMVNWSIESLKRELATIERIEFSAVPLIDEAIRRLVPADIDFWFRSSGGDERKSLGDRLAKHLDKSEVEILKREFHKQLDNCEITWKTVTMMIRIAVKTAG